MVWLHGGSNAIGSANDQVAPGVLNYDGVRLRNAAPRDVVIVSVNYRVGPLGFLAHPALSQESDEQVSGNYGLLDQQAALRWVKDNVAAFGGDPDNVTLFGESAGSTDTCYQSVLAGSAGLFQRMIMESGSCTMNVDTLEEGETKGAAFAQRLGCDGDDECALDCLRAKPGQSLQATRPARQYPGSPFLANPDSDYQVAWGEHNPGLTVVVDGVYLKEQPIAAFAAGRYARVPAIIGTNARETADKYTEGASLFANESEYRAAIEATFQAAPAIEKRYPVDQYASVNDAAIELSTDYYFVCPAWQLARRLSRHSDVYMYNWTRGVNTPDYAKYGAAHSVELVWLWDLWSVLGAAPAEAPLVTQMTDYWTALAETGDPNREGSPTWPKYREDEDQELAINLEPRVEMGRRDARCPLWSKVFATQWGDAWEEL
jgi:para-nitrobenzyl esterase